MIYFLFAQGFEESEGIIPYDMLKRAGLEVVLASVADTLAVTGGHGLSVNCDIFASAIKKETIELLVLPGGSVGTENLDQSEVVNGLLQYAWEKNLPIAAICAAPSILGKRGFLKGKEAICYPDFFEYLEGAVISDKNVVIDGNMITAKAAGASFDFGLALVEFLADKETAEKIKASIFYQ